MYVFVCLFVCVPACENEISSAVTETKQAEMRCVCGWGDVWVCEGVWVCMWVSVGGMGIHVDCAVQI